MRMLRTLSLSQVRDEVIGRRRKIVIASEKITRNSIARDFSDRGQAVSSKSTGSGRFGGSRCVKGATLRGTKKCGARIMATGRNSRLSYGRDTCSDGGCASITVSKELGLFPLLTK